MSWSSVLQTILLRYYSNMLKSAFSIDTCAQEMGIRSANPLLANIEDMLIEEASAEEDELLGRNDEPESQRQACLLG